VLAILHITKSFLLEEAVDEERLDLFELREQLVKFLVVVLFDRLDFFSHIAEFRYLVLDFVLKLRDFALEVGDTEFIQHHDVVIAVLSQQAFEADTTKIVLAEGLDVFRWMELALGVAELGPGGSIESGKLFVFSCIVLNRTIREAPVMMDGLTGGAWLF
jgi:hypothetical protein